MKGVRAFLVALLCALLGACGDMDIDPQPATEEYRALLERRIVAGYTLKDVYQVPAGENEQDLIKPDGVIVGGLIDGPEGDDLFMALYHDTDNGRIINLGWKRYWNGQGRHISASDVPHARALRTFIKNR